MKYEISKTTTEVIDIDLSTPIYRSMHGAAFAKIWDKEGNPRSVSIFETSFYFKNSIDHDAVNCIGSWVESTEADFNEGVKKYLSENGINL